MKGKLFVGSLSLSEKYSFYRCYNVLNVYYGCFLHLHCIMKRGECELITKVSERKFTNRIIWGHFPGEIIIAEKRGKAYHLKHFERLLRCAVLWDYIIC